MESVWLHYSGWEHCRYNHEWSVGKLNKLTRWKKKKNVNEDILAPLQLIFDIFCFGSRQNINSPYMCRN